MEFSVPGFIKRFCGPNAMLTLAEYLEDYATPEVKEKGYKAIFKKIDSDSISNKEVLLTKIEKIRKGERDLYF
jgi:2-iminoacetate synthase